MKVKASVKADPSKGDKIVRRRGRIYVINKRDPNRKQRQKMQVVPFFPDFLKESYRPRFAIQKAPRGVMSDFPRAPPPSDTCEIHEQQKTILTCPFCGRSDMAGPPQH